VLVVDVCIGNLAWGQVINMWKHLYVSILVTEKSKHSSGCRPVVIFGIWEVDVSLLKGLGGVGSDIAAVVS
jgi:hypothetical protein